MAQVGALNEGFVNTNIEGQEISNHLKVVSSWYYFFWGPRNLLELWETKILVGLYSLRCLYL